MDWDDYKYFSALASTRSVRGAAALLGVNASTVSRRLELFEDRLGLSLFTRSQQGLQITPEGAEVVSRVERVAQDLGDIEGFLRGRDKKLSGQIRVVIPEVIGLGLVVPELYKFQQAYPDIDLHLLPSHANLDIAKREADVSISSTHHPTESLAGRKVASLALAAYASTELMDALPDTSTTAQMTTLPWLDWAGTSDVCMSCMRMRREYASDSSVKLHSHSLLLHQASARQGLGVAVLPCILAESDPGLQRVTSIAPILGPPMWMLIHPDLRGTQRVAVFLQFVRDVFARRSHELLASGVTVGEAGLGEAGLQSSAQDNSGHDDRTDADS